MVSAAQAVLKICWNAAPQSRSWACQLLAIEDLVRPRKRSAIRIGDWWSIWLRELRTPELLSEVVAAHPELARAASPFRPAVQAAILGRADDIAAAMEAEEMEERRKDREYWQPLKRELEELRLGRNRQES